MGPSSRERRTQGLSCIASRGSGVFEDHCGQVASAGAVRGLAQALGGAGSAITARHPPETGSVGGDGGCAARCGLAPGLSRHQEVGGRLRGCTMWTALLEAL